MTDYVFLIAAVLVFAEGLLSIEPLYLVMVPVLQVVVAAMCRPGNRIVPAEFRAPVVFMLYSALIVGWGLLVGISLGGLVLLPGALAVALAATWNRPQRLAIVAALALPCAGLSQMAMLGWSSPTALDAGALALWSLIAWPFLALMFAGRHWYVAVGLGLPCLLTLMGGLLAHSHLRVVLLQDAIWQVGSTSDSLLLATQLVVVVACALPLVLESDLRWRYLLFAGILCGSLEWLMFTWSGPWVEGPPFQHYVVLFGSIAASGVGLIGIMATVKRPGLLSTAAVRAAALGLGASAVRLSAVWNQSLDPANATTFLAAIMVPMLVGFGLALLVAIAGLYGKRVPGGVVQTAKIRHGWNQFRLRGSQVAKGFAVDVSSSLIREWRHWVTPAGLVPMLVFAAAWPALHAIGWLILAVACVPLSMLLSGLARRHLYLWIAGHLVLVLWLAYLSGVPTWWWPGVVALAFLAAWPFLRWPQLDAVWAFPATSLILLPLLIPTAPVDGLPVVLTGGCIVLLANGLRRGPTRWLMLGWSTIFSIVFLGWWVEKRDPFSTVIFSQLTWFNEFLQLIGRMGMVGVVLMILWVARAHGLGRWRTITKGTWLALMVIATITASLWAIGYRPGPYEGLAFWALLLFIAPLLARELHGDEHVHIRHYRFPVLDGLALALAALLVAGAQGVLLVEEAVRNGGIEVAGTRMVKAGDMGVTLVAVIRDILAVVVAIPMVLSLRKLFERTQMAPVDYAMKTLRLARPKGKRKPIVVGPAETTAD